MKKKVVIRTSFTAVHCWPECPYEDVNYLRNPHRHEFHVTVKFDVSYNDRDIEFIRAKEEIDKHLRTNYHCKDLGRMSCEDIANEIMNKFGACFVSVFEDNENGAEIEQ